MKNYYKIMLGKKSRFAEECLKDNFIGADYGIHEDLTGKLPDDWRIFNRQFNPIYLKLNPQKSKVAAGLACGALWTVAKGIKIGDIVLSPNGHGEFMVGEATGDYSYHPNETLPHRRPIKWYDFTINRKIVSADLKSSTNSSGTSSEITRHAEEIERFIAGNGELKEIVQQQNIIDTAVFVLEKYLEEFLVSNWNITAFGKDYEIYKVDDEVVGQQFKTETGFIDILAQSKDKQELLVIELKKGRSSDIVIGQVQRYMGDVIEEVAEDQQKVKGVIIALEDDIKLRRALKVARDIEFYKYELKFKLHKI